ncbi:MAG: phosphatase PAP2 family protein [Chlorobiaceae bacterium]
MKKFISRASILFFSFLLSCTLLNEAHASGVETAGSILQILLPAGAAAVTYDRHDSEGFVQLAESGILTLGVTYGLKFTIPETRPNGGKHSFPSGHTSTSFAAAEFLRTRYGLDYGIPAYLAASFVGYSRVEAKEHYTRDVISGAAVGIMSANVFTTHNKNWNVRTQTGPSGYGITLTGLF